MLTGVPIIGFIPVSDLTAAEQFYRHTLGLPFVEKNPFAVVFAAPGGATIRCVQAPPFQPQPFTIFGWDVLDITAAVHDLKAKGIQPILYPHFEQDPDGIWVAPGGTRIVWFHDPDANVLSLTGHPGATKR